MPEPEGTGALTSAHLVACAQPSSSQALHGPSPLLLGTSHGTPASAAVPLNPAQARGGVPLTPAWAQGAPGGRRTVLLFRDCAAEAKDGSSGPFKTNFAGRAAEQPAPALTAICCADRRLARPTVKR